MRNRLSIGHWISLCALNLVLCYLAGKDYNWDLLNYHFYGPALLLDGRWNQDYFAGSIQSYLNPIAYIPFYLMVKAGWPALLIGLILSAFNFLNIIIVGSIAEKLLSKQAADCRVLIYLLCLLAMVSPIYLQLNGSSFNDPYGSVFILLGLRVLLQEDRSVEQQALLVGLCSGLATGIKLTSATFAIAFAILLVMRAVFDRNTSYGRLALQLTLYGLAAVLSFAIAHGFWSVRLWQEFGSPLFPFFNAIFKAPEFSIANNRDFRFLGSGIWGLLWLPLDMLRVQGWIYSETVSPDLRPSVLFVLAIVCAIVSLWRSGQALATKSRPTVRQVTSSYLAPRWTPAIIATAFFVVSFLLWGVTSRIGRYAFSLWLLLGPLLGVAAIYLGGIKFARVIVGSVLCLQAYVHVVHGSHRWSPVVAWDSSWLDFQLPPPITQRPAGIISMDTLSFSAIVPSLHPASGMTTIMGMHTIANGSEMPERLNSLIKRYGDNLYVLYAIGQFVTSEKVEISPVRLNILNEKLAPYGLRTQFLSASVACEYGRLPFNRKINDWSQGPSVREDYVFAFCKLVETSAMEKAEATKKGRANDRIFDLIEDMCPNVFAPKRIVTIHHNDEYIRSYFNTASGLYTDHGGLYMTGYRVLLPIYLGQLREISEMAKAADFTCPSLPAHRYLAD